MDNQNYNPLNSEWITANAGSGKTYALTKRVVQLLLRGISPECICCITYTKAAASEMRARVLEDVRGLLLADEATCRAQVASLLGTPATDADITRARSLFAALLDSPTGGVQLTTIHGFCQNILRRFPLEAGIAPHFTVLDEAATQTLLHTAKQRVLAHALTEDVWLRDALALMGERMGESRIDALMKEIITKRLMWAEIWRAQTPETVQAHLYALHGLAENLTHEMLDAAFCNHPGGAMAEQLWSLIPALMQHKNKKEQALGECYSRWMAATPEARLTQIDTVLGHWCTADGSLTKTPFSVKRDESLFPALDYLRTTVTRYVAQKAALACAEESFAVALLAQSLLTRYDQAKQAAHALDYDDLIHLTRMLFAQSETLGWVMRKLDHRMDHVLVDEAQDTSAEQWNIVALLVEEFIASNEGVGSGNLPRSLLVVGDEKQSIYSFNGAAPELFAQKRGPFEAMLGQGASPLVPRVLDISYRSSASVLALVDHLAMQPEMAASLTTTGTVHRHQIHRTGAAGRVTLYPPVIAPERVTLEPLVIPTHSFVTRSGPQLLATQIADTIHQWLHVEKRVLASTGTPLDAGDILILVHRRAPLMLPLIRALERAGIPVAGLDRLTLADHLAVKDLLALMRWCIYPGDDLALAQVLRSPIMGMSDAQLRQLAVGRTGSLWAQVDSPMLARWREMRYATPYDFLTDVLEGCGIRRQFAERFGSEVHEVLDELKAQAATMPPGLLPTLVDFEHWIASSERQIKREQEGRAAGHVRIMTVHGAKGLEAPVVLMVDTVSVPTTAREIAYFPVSAQGQKLPALAFSEPAKQAEALVQAKQQKAEALLAEYRRLLYVATTRARDELHVFGSASKKGEVKKNSWYEAITTSMRALNAEENDGCLTLQNAATAPVAGHSSGSPAPPLVLPEWAEHAPLSLPRATITFSPSAMAPEAVSSYVPSSTRGAKARGVRMHRVLELLSAETDRATIRQLVTHLAPDWRAVEQAAASAEISVLHQQEQWLWHYPAYAEATLCGHITVDGQSLPVHGQIDRLVEMPDAMVIVDYKTGQYVPSHPSEVSLNYRVQLKTYQALVRQIYPHKPVRVAILWTAAPRLMWLDAEVESTPWNYQNVIQQRTVDA